MRKVRLMCIAAAVMTTMLSSTVYVQAGESLLDIDNVTSMAIENSYEVKNMDISIQKYQNSYKDATRSGNNDNADIEAKYDIYQYTNLKEAAKNSVKLNVYTQYVSFMNAKEALDLEQQKFQNAEEKYKKAQLQLKVGLIAEPDVKTIKQAYDDEKAQLNKVQRNFDSITKAINQISGLNINTTYNGFTKDIAVENPTARTYNDYLNDALKNRAEILNDNEKIKLKKTEFAGIRGVNPYNYMPEYVIGKYGVTEAENQLDTDKIDISIEINGLYNDLQSKIQKLKSQIANYNAEKEKYDEALQKYNSGMIIKIDLEDQLLSFKLAENSLKAAQRDIGLAKLKIEYASYMGKKSTNTTALAEAAPVDTTNDTITLTLDDALNNVEKNNTELKLMNEKINSLNKQYDIDHNYATTINVNGKDPKVALTNVYLAAKLLQEVKPLYDVQLIKDAKNARDERINVIKFDMQREYMNVLNSRDQIDNINKTLVNIEEKIKQLQGEIKVGQVTANELDPLNVEKSQLSSQIEDIQDGIDQSLLKIKQYLNIDLNKTLNLVPSKKAFVKFDDKDIMNRINDGVNKDYVLSSIRGYIDIAKNQNEIYSNYAHNYFSDPGNLMQSAIKQKGLEINYVTDETSSKSQIADLQNKLITANVGLPQVLKGTYYSLRSKENAVETQILTEKSAQDTYDKLKKNFEAGNTDKVTLDSAALELDKQKNLTERTVNEYMVAQDEFKYMLQGHASAYKNISTQSMGVSGIDY